MLAAIEAGGASFLVAIARAEDPLNVVESAVIPTTSPEETLDSVKKWLLMRKFDSLGVACFGPLDLRPESTTYGSITTTPKTLWRGFPIVTSLKSAFNCPIALDTDVNAPALSEMVYGEHGDGISSVAYVTVGTGIGVGLCIGGQPVHGLVHPEGGHIPCPKAPGDESFAGVCPWHGNRCVEGNACSGALAARKKIPPAALADLPDSDPLWDIEAFYLGYLCATVTLMVSPEVIVFGGGIPRRLSLYPKIRANCVEMLNGYVASDKVGISGIASYIVRSKFGTQSGILGAVELSRRAWIASNAPH